MLDADRAHPRERFLRSGAYSAAPATITSTSA